MRRTEGHFRGVNQTELFYQTWWAEQAHGTLVVTHGLGEHSDCYDQFVHRLNSPKWNIHAWDLRGHGRSEGRRGLCRSFDEYSLDLAAFLKHLEQAHPIHNGPVVILGHSLGGLITLKTVVDHDVNVTAVAVSSPLLGISMKVPPIKDMASKLLAKYLPSVTLYTEMKYEHLSRDSQMIESYKNDPLRHERISPALYRGMIDAMESVVTHPQKLKKPFLMQLAGHDLIVNANASRTFFESLPLKDKTLHVYEDSYHEIFNDLDYTHVMADLNRFLERF